MGLDIYLYRYDKSRAEIKREDEAWEKVSDEIFHKHYDPVEKARGKDANLTDAEREAWKKEANRAAEEFGRVGEWHDNPHNPKIKINSALYPEHLFKIGYFRSSYNGAGINNVLRDRIKQDLYSIIGVSSDKYVQQPDWHKVIANCELAIATFRDVVAKNPFSFMEVSPNMFASPSELPKSGEEALEIARKTLVDREHSEMMTDGFGDRHGEWYPKGLKVYGMVPGVNTFFGKAHPTTYVIVRWEKEGEEPFKWYINALEIVKETAEWVLKQENPEKYYLHVSG